MNPVIYVNSKLCNSYKNYSFVGKIKDRFKIHLVGESFIKDLKLRVVNVKLPPNFDKRAYGYNMNIAKNMMKNSNSFLAPKTYRNFDYNIYNAFQKNLMSFSVAKSSQLLLRISKKSIRSSCIVIYDASDNINFNIICFMARESKYIILLSDNINKARKIGEYITANYGITPIITKDVDYALKSADVVINSKKVDIETDGIMWCLNNKYIPKRKVGFFINDITYKTPWNINQLEMYPEILGAILSQMEEKDIEASLKYNGIYLDKIKFNEKTINTI